MAPGCALQFVNVVVAVVVFCCVGIYRTRDEQRHSRGDEMQRLTMEK